MNLMKALLLLGVVVLLGCTAARAGTIIIDNRTSSPAEFRLLASAKEKLDVTLPAGEARPFPADKEVLIKYRAQGEDKKETLSPNCIYLFVVGQGPKGPQIFLTQVGLGDPLPVTKDALPGLPQKPLVAPEPGVLQVKIMVDEEEQAPREEWEARLKARVAAASDILEKACFMKLKVVSTDTWKSDNKLQSFEDSLTEFERVVSAQPAQVAIGFTSQYKILRGKSHLGGTRGAWQSHVLIREWSNQATPPERLEVLVHELGHLLGSAHSPESNSVMRPILADKQSRLRDFNIRFDSVNMLAMNLHTEEYRRLDMRNVYQLSPSSQVRVRQIYETLAEALPDDPAAGDYAKRVDHMGVIPMVKGVQIVLEAIHEDAGANRPLTKAGQRLDGDPWASELVRRGAKMAADEPQVISRTALLCGLAIGLTKSPQLQEHPVLKPILEQIESKEKRDERLRRLGSPTARAREDLLAHFMVSAALTSMLGGFAAEQVGLDKEQKDMTTPGGSGFSFADYQADLAGVTFAERLNSGQLSLEEVSKKFKIEDYMPAIDGLPNDLDSKAFTSQYGSVGDPRFQRQRALIMQRIYQQFVPKPH
jgi:exonuclease VII small subunit